MLLLMSRFSLCNVTERLHRMTVKYQDLWYKALCCMRSV